MKRFVASFAGILFLASAGLAQEKPYRYYYPTFKDYSYYPNYSDNHRIGKSHTSYQDYGPRSQFDESRRHGSHRRSRNTYIPYKLGGFYLWYRWNQHRR